MGDVAMTIPLLLNLVERFPSVKITVVTQHMFAAIFSSIENVTVHPAEIRGKHKGILGLRRLAQELNDISYTHIADLHDVIRTKLLGMFLENRPKAVIDKGRAQKKTLVQSNTKILKQLKPTHQRYADVFQTLGFKLSLDPTFLSKQKLSKRIIQLTGSQQKKWIGIAPFAAHAGKQYSLDLLKVVVRELIERDYSIFLFGASTEANTLSRLKEGDTVIIVAGELTFPEELALISNLDLMISMDSGNGHLAANYNVPVITLWGVTHPYAGFTPFAQPFEHQLLSDRETYPAIPTSIYGNKYPTGYENAINTITPAMLIEKVEEVLG
ncbi:glycosyltransferase family 9 protein [Gangjinia marincola]|uniref:Glycosyltransferase family 9 protein n=2 Tax=Gangjinia marincola TaxID=578463 RepID=A0ABN1MHX0_9FLAO